MSSSAPRMRRAGAHLPPWLPAAVGAVAVWIAIAIVARHGLGGTLQQGAIVASFLVVVGIGQMFVITCGGGNIDLSVPYVMTLVAYLGTEAMDGSDARLPFAIAIALGVGLVVGLANALTIRWLDVPPLIATLAVGFVVQTVVQLRSAHSGGDVSPLLQHVVTARLLGVPAIAAIAALAAVLAHVVLTRTLFGRGAQAAGQSRDAARLAGLRPERVVLLAYCLCGMTAGLGGLLLSGFTGGPSLDMATTYQLGAIAVVVLGGSLIAGGSSNVPGIWAAALLLTFLITLVDVTHAGPGVQPIVVGGVIVLVLAIVRGPERT